MHTVGVVVDQVEAGFVVDCSQVGLSNTETDSIGKSLTKRAGRDLNAIGVASLGMTRCERAELTELLQIIHRQLEAKKMEENVLQSTSRRSFR